MCLPIIAPVLGIVSAGLGIASAVSSMRGQRQQAEAQEQAQSDASILEQQRYLAEMSASRLKERQEKVAAAQRIQQSTTKAREARATALTSAFEGGVTGLSVDGLINSMTRKEAEFGFSVQQQMQMGSLNRTIGFEDGYNRHRMNLLGINKPINQPDYLGSLVSGAQVGMNAYSFGSDAGLFQGSSTT